ncbi:MAG: hypothetical protein LBR94_07160 [Desulfovibrio sp.]|jgi:hypothetical protein|nr:hypothetical protein [Desulfovibrio sp.]
MSDLEKSAIHEMREYLQKAAMVVEAQLGMNPELAEIGVPVDPDVADYMGAFEEDALVFDDPEEMLEGGVA